MNSPVSFLTNLRQDRLQRCEMSFWNKIINALKSSRGNINNSNCTEWSAIWAGIILVISKSNERAALVQFEITRMISDQNCTTHDTRHEVQLPLYYINFEIAKIQDVVSSNILLMQYWAGLKLNSSIFWGEKGRVLEIKVAKFATWYSLSFIFLQFDRLL